MTHDEISVLRRGCKVFKFESAAGNMAARKSYCKKKKLYQVTKYLHHLGKSKFHCMWSNDEPFIIADS